MKILPSSFRKCPRGNSCGSLIEDWPHNKSAQNPYKNENKESTRKRVRFSSSSTCRVYLMNPSYEVNKSYTEVDQKAFGRLAMAEVIKIRRALSTFRNDSAKGVTLIQIESLGITREEILGLEHLALTSSPSTIMKVRRRHSKSILLEQKKQKMMGVGDDAVLAHLSALASKKSVEQAWIRARDINY